MPAILEGLSDAELGFFSSLPRKAKSELFGQAERIYDQLRDTLVRTHPGKTFLINLQDMSWRVGVNYKDCLDHLPKPCQLGQNVFTVLIAPRS